MTATEMTGTRPQAIGAEKPDAAVDTTLNAETARLYRRILRRETHSPRSTLAIVLAVMLVVVCLWLATEIILQLVAQPPLIASVSEISAWLAEVGKYPAWILILAGVLLAVVGLLIVVASLTPGRRPRHVVKSATSAAIVDNEVIASALARHAALAGSADPDNVRVSVSSREAVIRLTPTTGVTVDTAAVTSAVQAQLDSYDLEDRIRLKVVVATEGKVGE